MAAIPIGSDKYVLDRALGVVSRGSADRLVRCLAIMPIKQAVALTVIESLGQTSTYLERALGTGLSLEAHRRQTIRNSGSTTKSPRHRVRRRHSRSLRGAAQQKSGKSIIKGRHAHTQLRWIS